MAAVPRAPALAASPAAAALAAPAAAAAAAAAAPAPTPAPAAAAAAAAPASSLSFSGFFSGLYSGACRVVSVVGSGGLKAAKIAVALAPDLSHRREHHQKYQARRVARLAPPPAKTDGPPASSLSRLTTAITTPFAQYWLNRLPALVDAVGPENICDKLLEVDEKQEAANRAIIEKMKDSAAIFAALDHGSVKIAHLLAELDGTVKNLCAKPQSKAQLIHGLHCALSGVIVRLIENTSPPPGGRLRELSDLVYHLFNQVLTEEALADLTRAKLADAAGRGGETEAHLQKISKRLMDVLFPKREKSLGITYKVVAGPIWYLVDTLLFAQLAPFLFRFFMDPTWTKETYARAGHVEISAIAKMGASAITKILLESSASKEAGSLALKIGTLASEWLKETAEQAHTSSKGRETNSKDGETKGKASGSSESEIKQKEVSKEDASKEGGVKQQEGSKEGASKEGEVKQQEGSKEGASKEREVKDSDPISAAVVAALNKLTRMSSPAKEKAAAAEKAGHEVKVAAAEKVAAEVKVAVAEQEVKEEDFIGKAIHDFLYERIEAQLKQGILTAAEAQFAKEGHLLSALANALKPALIDFYNYGGIALRDEYQIMAALDSSDPTRAEWIEHAFGRLARRLLEITQLNIPLKNRASFLAKLVKNGLPGWLFNLYGAWIHNQPGIKGLIRPEAEHARVCQRVSELPAGALYIKLAEFLTDAILKKTPDLLKGAPAEQSPGLAQLMAKASLDKLESLFPQEIAPVKPQLIAWLRQEILKIGTNTLGYQGLHEIVKVKINEILLNMFLGFGRNGAPEILNGVLGRIFKEIGDEQRQKLTATYQELILLKPNDKERPEDKERLEKGLAGLVPLFKPAARGVLEQLSAIDKDSPLAIAGMNTPGGLIEEHLAKLLAELGLQHYRSVQDQADTNERLNRLFFDPQVHLQAYPTQDPGLRDTILHPEQLVKGARDGLWNRSGASARTEATRKKCDQLAQFILSLIKGSYSTSKSVKESVEKINKQLILSLGAEEISKYVLSKEEQSSGELSKERMEQLSQKYGLSKEGMAQLRIVIQSLLRHQGKEDGPLFEYASKLLSIALQKAVLNFANRHEAPAMPEARPPLHRAAGMPGLEFEQKVKGLPGLPKPSPARLEKSKPAKASQAAPPAVAGGAAATPTQHRHYYFAQEIMDFVLGIFRKPLESLSPVQIAGHDWAGPSPVSRESFLPATNKLLHLTGHQPVSSPAHPLYAVPVLSDETKKKGWDALPAVLADLLAGIYKETEAQQRTDEAEERLEEIYDAPYLDPTVRVQGAMPFKEVCALFNGFIRDRIPSFLENPQLMRALIEVLLDHIPHDPAKKEETITCLLDNLKKFAKEPSESLGVLQNFAGNITEPFVFKAFVGMATTFARLEAAPKADPKDPDQRDSSFFVNEMLQMMQNFKEELGVINKAMTDLGYSQLYKVPPDVMRRKMGANLHESLRTDGMSAEDAIKHDIKTFFEPLFMNILELCNINEKTMKKMMPGPAGTRKAVFMLLKTQGPALLRLLWNNVTSQDGQNGMKLSLLDVINLILKTMERSIEDAEKTKAEKEKAGKSASPHPSDPQLEALKKKGEPLFKELLDSMPNSTLRGLVTNVKAFRTAGGDALAASAQSMINGFPLLALFQKMMMVTARCLVTGEFDREGKFNATGNGPGAPTLRPRDVRFVVPRTEQEKKAAEDAQKVASAALSTQVPKKAAAVSIAGLDKLVEAWFEGIWKTVDDGIDSAMDCVFKSYSTNVKMVVKGFVHFIAKILWVILGYLPFQLVMLIARCNISGTAQNFNSNISHPVLESVVRKEALRLTENMVKKKRELDQVEGHEESDEEQEEGEVKGAVAAGAGEEGGVILEPEEPGAGGGGLLAGMQKEEKASAAAAGSSPAHGLGPVQQVSSHLLARPSAVSSSASLAALQAAQAAPSEPGAQPPAPPASPMPVAAVSAASLLLQVE